MITKLFGYALSFLGVSIEKFFLSREEKARKKLIDVSRKNKKSQAKRFKLHHINADDIYTKRVPEEKP